MKHIKVLDNQTISPAESLSKVRVVSIPFVLKLATFMMFIGHGMLALSIKASWLPYLTFWGFSIPTAVSLMKIIGLLDLLVAIQIAFFPSRLIILWAVFWTFSTAIIRPLTGESFMEFVERGCNMAVPLILILHYKFPKTWKEAIHVIT